MKTAILIDGGFFLKRYSAVYGRTATEDGAQVVIKRISNLCLDFQKKFNFELYKIFFYDCKPFEAKVRMPISNNEFDFKSSNLAIFKEELFDHLRKTRKMVLRLGELKSGSGWLLKPYVTQELIKGKNNGERKLTDDDFYYDLQQKGVDLKIGLDIASLAYKKQAEQIILIAGDSDFVPAAKEARREGIDFILDPMWQHIDDNLFEHIDGLCSVCPNPNQKRTYNKKGSQ